MAKNPRSPQGDLRFEFGATVAQPSGAYNVAVKATALLGSQLQTGVAINFDVGGAVQTTSGTDSVGEAFATLTLSGAGTHWIGVSANVGGKPCRASRQVLAQAPTMMASQRDRLLAKVTGPAEDGSHTISVVIADKGGSPMQNVMVTFLYGGHRSQQRTDVDGTVVFVVYATSHDREGVIQVAGFEHEVVRLGPYRPMKGIDRPAARGANWWDAFLNGFRDTTAEIRRRQR